MKPSVAGMLMISLAACACAACARGSDVGTPLANADGGTGEVSSGGDDGLPVPESGQTDGSVSPDASCASLIEQATMTPVNVYMMMDKSSSMAGEKWDAASAGLKAFLQDPESDGLLVAVNFFPRDPDSTPVCDQTGYETPKAGFVELTLHASDIIGAMDAQAPNGSGTPMYPALGGAILECMKVAQNLPGQRCVVLLVTDGQPEGPAATCNGIDPEDPAQVASLAATGLSNNVLTYVVGLPGCNADTANEIAASGGTGGCIQVGTTNTEVDFQNALAAIRGQALPCDYELPSNVSGGQIDKNHVNVLYTPGGSATAQTIPMVPPDAGACSGYEWNYDDVANPTSIILCPDLCTQLKTDLGAKIEIEMGCATIIK